MSRVRQSERAFGLTFAALLAALACIGSLMLARVLWWVLMLSAMFLVSALTAPQILLPLNRLWGEISYRLGRVNNYVLLGLFFYVVIVPVGLFLRILGWDSMHRTLDRKERSYWTPVCRHTDADTLRDMF